MTIDKCEACNMGYGIVLDRCHGYNHANAIIEKIRELHKLIIDDNAACGDIDCCGEYEEWELCADCYCEYPCPTIRIIDGITDDDDEQENQRKCEVHEWKTYGTFGQECMKCGFTHDFS